MSNADAISIALSKTNLSESYTTQVNCQINAFDDMYQGNLEHYFSCGSQGAQLLRDAIGNVAAQKSLRILDFPCGFGRVTRWLPVFFPNARVFVSDLNEVAIDFLSSQLEVVPFKSAKNFEDIELDERFDLIWVGSLITHIDEQNALDLLKFVVTRLDQGGVALVTFLGPEMAKNFVAENPIYGLRPNEFKQVVHDYNESGFGYSNYPNQVDYGISLIADSWWEKWVKSYPEVKLSISSLAWDGHHNIATIHRP